MLSPRETRLLESLRLNPSRAFRGATKGERVSKRKGISIEFADFRNYSDGDDLRHLDWNVLARLETPVLRTYQDEEDLILYLVVDNSASMKFGEPEKAEVAAKVGAALGTIALIGGDAVRLVNGSHSAPPQQPLRGRSNARNLFSRLEMLEAGEKSVSQAIQSLLKGSVKNGLVILVSDGLDEALPQAIRALGGRGFEVWMAHVLDDGEIDPDLEGDLRLIDSENDQIAEITVNRDTLLAYKTNLQTHIEAIRQSVQRTGGKYTLVQTSESLEHTISRRMKPERWFA
ncbi:MAG: DUF58 domain-containing protein [Armatimonadota bacterium]